LNLPQSKLLCAAPTELSIGFTNFGEGQPAATKEISGTLEPTNIKIGSTKTLADFTLFPKLPYDIRHVIWLHLLPGPRVVRLTTSMKQSKFWEITSKIPTILHINQEARKVGQLACPQRFEEELGRSIYFDFSKDILYITNSIAAAFFFNRSVREDIDEVRILENLQRIAFPEIHSGLIPMSCARVYPCQL
jgi:hypothetical protein